MRSREARIADRVMAGVLAGMTPVEQEDWNDALEEMDMSLKYFESEMREGEMGSINVVGKAVQKVEREERNVSDPLTRRAVDGLLMEVARILNGAEVEKRRMEDEKLKHLGKCRGLQQEVRGLIGKFEALKGG